jgi:hypothetical protein
MEDRERDDRKRQRSGQPGEHRQNAAQPQRPALLHAEQRSAARNAAQRQRGHRQLRRQVTAAQRQQHDCRDGEHEHLDDHAEVRARPCGRLLLPHVGPRQTGPIGVSPRVQGLRGLSKGCRVVDDD